MTEKIIGIAIEVHRELGPGLLESVYQRCLAIALREDGLRVEEEKPVPIFFRGHQITDVGYRLDMLVEDVIILELKSAANYQLVGMRSLSQRHRAHGGRIKCSRVREF